jgi:hypothetical protein
MSEMAILVAPARVLEPGAVRTMLAVSGTETLTVDPASVLTETALALTEATVPMTRLEAGAGCACASFGAATTARMGRQQSAARRLARTAGRRWSVRLILIPWYLAGTWESDGMGQVKFQG